MEKIKLVEKLARLSEHGSPKIGAAPLFEPAATVSPGGSPGEPIAAAPEWI